MPANFNPQAYFKWTNELEEPFKKILIPVSKIHIVLKEAAKMTVTDNSPIIDDLKDFAARIEKFRLPTSKEEAESNELWHLPVHFEQCIHAQTAGKTWIEEIKTRWLLLKLIKIRTQEVLEQINISSAMISSQPKLLEALKAFELVSKLGQQLEEFPSWNKLVSSLTTEAKTLSYAKSSNLTKQVIF